MAGLNPAITYIEIQKRGMNMDNVEIRRTAEKRMLLMSSSILAIKSCIGLKRVVESILRNASHDESEKVYSEWGTFIEIVKEIHMFQDHVLKNKIPYVFRCNAISNLYDYTYFNRADIEDVDWYDIKDGIIDTMDMAIRSIDKMIIDITDWQIEINHMILRL